MITLPHGQPSLSLRLTLLAPHPAGPMALCYQPGPMLLGLREWPAYIASIAERLTLASRTRLAEESAYQAARVLGVPVAVQLGGPIGMTDGCLLDQPWIAPDGRAVAAPFFPTLPDPGSSLTRSFARLCSYSGEPRSGSTLTVKAEGRVRIGPTALAATLQALRRHPEPMELEVAVQKAAEHLANQVGVAVRVQAHCILGFGMELVGVAHAESIRTLNARVRG